MTTQGPESNKGPKEIYESVGLELANDIDNVQKDADASSEAQLNELIFEAAILPSLEELAKQVENEQDPVALQGFTAAARTQLREPYLQKQLLDLRAISSTDDFTQVPTRLQAMFEFLWGWHLKQKTNTSRPFVGPTPEEIAAHEAAVARNLQDVTDAVQQRIDASRPDPGHLHRTPALAQSSLSSGSFERTMANPAKRQPREVGVRGRARRKRGGAEG